MLNKDYRDILHALSDDLIRDKKASGRTKDLADAKALEFLKTSEQIAPPDKE